MSKTKHLPTNIGVGINKDLVKKLDSEAVQPKFTKHRYWEPNANVKEISIGDPDPVMSFKEWSKVNFDKITG